MCDLEDPLGALEVSQGDYVVIPTSTTHRWVVTGDQPLRVLLCGQYQADFRGIDDGYGAVAHARWFHQKLDLIRVSQWAPTRE